MVITLSYAKTKINLQIIATFFSENGQANAFHIAKRMTVLYIIDKHDPSS